MEELNEGSPQATGERGGGEFSVGESGTQGSLRELLAERIKEQRVRMAGEAEGSMKLPSQSKSIFGLSMI